MGEHLDFAYKQLAAGLSGNDDVRNDWVRIETDSTGKDRLVLTGLEKLDEPASLSMPRPSEQPSHKINDRPGDQQSRS